MDQKLINKQQSGEKVNNKVVSGVILVLDAFISHIESCLPGVSVIYDENLGFDTGARLIRDNNNLRDEFNKSLPAIFYRRSVLRPQEEAIGRRSISQNIANKVSDTNTDTYNMIAATFDFEFQYTTTKMSEFENFEISWLTEQGIPSAKTINVDIPNLGSFEYYAKYNTLDDKMLSSQGNYYKYLSSVINIRGNYLVFNSNSKHIKEIQKRIYHVYGALIEQETIK